MTDDRLDDPLGVEADEEKREGASKEGPPVGQMATTYGSSFIGSEEEAEAVASQGTQDDEPPAPRDSVVNEPGTEASS